MIRSNCTRLDFLFGFAVSLDLVFLLIGSNCTRLGLVFLLIMFGFALRLVLALHLIRFNCTSVVLRCVLVLRLTVFSFALVWLELHFTGFGLTLLG